MDPLMGRMDAIESDFRMQAYFQRVRDTIFRDGWMIQGVYPAVGQEYTIPFAYTIGLHSAGLPELIISFAGEPTVAQSLLNAAGTRHIEKEIIPGETLDEVANVPFRAIHADPLKAEIQQAYNYYNDPHKRRRRIKLVQIIWPDEAGLFPDEDGYDQETFPQEMWP